MTRAEPEPPRTPGEWEHQLREITRQLRTLFHEATDQFDGTTADHLAAAWIATIGAHDAIGQVHPHTKHFPNP
ncbi:MAG: hypothetical protein ACRC0L_11405 [Angustibacter sp.]